MTIHSNWTLFRQQMSGITNGDDDSAGHLPTDTDSMLGDEEHKLGISWEWQRYRNRTSNSTATSTNATSSTTTTMAAGRGQYNVLIAQYDAGGSTKRSNNSYATLLNISSRINQLYAQQYQYDYVLLRGIVFRNTFSESSYTATQKIPSSRATYNKVYILQKAIEWKYDYLLLLDSDAMIYDFNRDITPSILPPQKLLVAHQVTVGHNKNNRDGNSQNEYYNINIGVTLWNIRHAMIRTILRRWKILCYVRIIFRLDDNDQHPLQELLQHYVTFGRSLSSTNQYLHANIIEENHHDFAYRDGAFIKHFIRYNSQSWIQPENDDHRVEEMTNVANEICRRHAPLCHPSSVAS